MRINYELIGDKDRDVIIFLHGLMGSGRDWKPITKHLEREFCCIVVDLPGHGESDNVSFDTFLSFIADLKCTSAKHHLVGYSMGGRVALRTLLRFPDIFESVVVESPGLGIEDEIERSTRYREDKKLFENISTEQELKSFLENWYDNPIFGRIKDLPQFRALIEDRLAGDYKKWQISLNEFSVGKRKDMWRQLAYINTPVTYISGGFDKKYSDEGKRFAQLCENGKHLVLETCAHNTHFEDSLDFAGRLKCLFGSGM